MRRSRSSLFTIALIAAGSSACTVTSSLDGEGGSGGLGEGGSSEGGSSEGGSSEGSRAAVYGYEFAVEFGGEKSPEANQIDGLATDAAGSLYTTGFTCATAGCVSATGEKSAFTRVKKTNPDGEVQWSLSLSGLLAADEPGANNAYDLGISGADDALYISGSFQGALTYPDPDGNEQTVSSLFGEDGEPSVDAFVARVDPSTGRVVWLVRFGGSDLDGGNEIEVDPSGNVLATVTTASDTIDFGQGFEPFVRDTTFDAGSVRPPDSFVVKVSSDGDITWIRHFEGAGGERLRAIETDVDGHVLAGLEFIGELRLGNVTYNTADARLDGGAFFKLDGATGETLFAQPLYDADLVEAAAGTDLLNGVDYNVRGVYGGPNGEMVVCGVFKQQLPVGMAVDDSAITLQAPTADGGAVDMDMRRADYVIVYDRDGRVLWADAVAKDEGSSGCEIDGDDEGNFAIIGTLSGAARVVHFDATNAYNGEARSLARGLSAQDASYYLLRYPLSGDSAESFGLQEIGARSTGSDPRLEEGGTLHVHPAGGWLSFGIRVPNGGVVVALGSQDAPQLFENPTSLEQGLALVVPL
ncbi:MAG: hypothetical protein AAF715_32195 [Myxococcota bacterium]